MSDCEHDWVWVPTEVADYIQELELALGRAVTLAGELARKLEASIEARSTAIAAHRRRPCDRCGGAT